jgi:hypothetical protein
VENLFELLRVNPDLEFTVRSNGDRFCFELRHRMYKAGQPIYTTMISNCLVQHSTIPILDVVYEELERSIKHEQEAQRELRGTRS